MDVGNSLAAGEHLAEAAALLRQYGKLHYLPLNDNDFSLFMGEPRRSFRTPGSSVARKAASGFCVSFAVGLDGRSAGYRRESRRACLRKFF